MATQAFGEEQRALSVGKAFSRGFDAIRAYPLQTLGPIFVLTVVPGLLFQTLGVNALMAAAARGTAPPPVGLIIIGGILLSLLWGTALGAVIQATLAYAEGRKPELGEMLRAAVARCVPLVIVYLLYTLAIMVGFLLFIVPGIFIATMWSMAMVAVVAERPGVFGAFGRSARLTKGARWKILGVFVAMFVIYIIVLSFAGLTGAASTMSLASLQAAPQASVGIGQIIIALINALLTTWMAAMFTSLFIELREWKEGPDTSRLSDIFA
ncbi:hypothetical protein [Sphingomonas sp.]|uniref:hypothetical protein n=1 Tax=Sphingomonas sp. TaxID=28214 RepID=UPI00257DB281|nr:hypothetical protein [Sphingomonas sp.]